MNIRIIVVVGHLENKRQEIQNEWNCWDSITLFCFWTNTRSLASFGIASIHHYILRRWREEEKKTKYCFITSKNNENCYNNNNTNNNCSASQASRPGVLNGNAYTFVIARVVKCRDLVHFDFYETLIEFCFNETSKRTTRKKPLTTSSGRSFL